MKTQHFFLNGEHFGSAARLRNPLHPSFPYGYGFFCPHCCSLWAIAPIESRPALAIHHTCERCTPPPGELWLGPPGSLWLSYDPDFTAALPEALLRRELSLHLTHYAKELA